MTPIDAAMTQVQADTALANKTRGDFAPLITDGMQAGCNAQNGNNVTIQALTALANAGVRTFVVGFGSSVSVASLYSFAQAGGAVNPAGPHQLNDAADQASLEGALGAIAQATLSCVLQPSQPPPNGDSSSIFVYFDKMPPPVTRDPTRQNGWDYDPVANTVTFYGAACDALKRGTVSAADSNPFAVTLYVRRWTGSSWDALGDGQIVGERAYHTALVAPDGTAPFVSGGPLTLTLQVWNGTAWADRCRSDHFPVSTVFAVGHDERPVVALYDNVVYSEKLLAIRLK